MEKIICRLANCMLYDDYNVPQSYPADRPLPKYLALYVDELPQVPLKDKDKSGKVVMRMSNGTNTYFITRNDTLAKKHGIERLFSVINSMLPKKVELTMDKGVVCDILFLDD